MTCAAVVVREEWLFSLVRQVQLLADRLPPPNPELASRLGILMPPATALEHLIYGLAVRQWPTQTVKICTGVDRSKVSMAAELLRGKHAERWKIATLARAVGMKPDALERGFRNYLGCPIHQYLLRVRIAAAIPLLLESSLKTEAVAATVGFRHKKAFFAAFRRIMGMTPNQLRRSRTA